MAVVVRLPERIEGPRLLLRRWRIRDLEPMADVVGRNVEHLRPWMPWIASEPLTVDQRRQLLETWEKQWAEGGDVGFAVRLRVPGEGEIVGSCGLHRRVGEDGLEIGYWIDQGHLRRGYATELGGLLTTAAFTVPGVTFVEIHHDKANVASGGVPRGLGYTLVAERPDDVQAPAEAGVECVWRMTAAEWPG